MCDLTRRCRRLAVKLTPLDCPTDTRTGTGEIRSLDATGQFLGHYSSSDAFELVHKPQTALFTWFVVECMPLTPASFISMHGRVHTLTCIGQCRRVTNWSSLIARYTTCLPACIRQNLVQTVVDTHVVCRDSGTAVVDAEILDGATCPETAHARPAVTRLLSLRRTSERWRLPFKADSNGYRETFVEQRGVIQYNAHFSAVGIRPLVPAAAPAAATAS